MLSRSRSETCVSDLVLDELVVGELTPGEEHAASTHLKSCVACGERLESLRERRDPLPPLAAPRPVRRWLPRLALGGAAMAAGLALVVVLRPAEIASTRSKGNGQRLTLFVKHGGETRQGGSAETVRAGDTLSFATSSPQASFVAVLSHDGPGKASVYFPSGGRAARVEGGHEVILPTATVLDDEAGTEQLYALFCSTPEALEPLRSALATSGVLPLPAGCAIDTLTLSKVR
jgi:anti-sigma factor RsiW